MQANMISEVLHHQQIGDILKNILIIYTKV